MDLLLLEKRFEHYAVYNKALLHVPGNKHQKAFTSYDIENLHAAIETGLKFPCLFIETPSAEKEGLNDNVFENYESSYMVLAELKDGDYNNKSTVVQQCKTICDQIYNRLLLDAPEYFESQLSKTTEGIVTTSNNLIGWVVAFGFSQAYNAEVEPGDWEDLI
jgi:hypothetical protein